MATKKAKKAAGVETTSTMQQALRLAVEASVDPRTAARAIAQGSAAIRVCYVRDRIALAAKKLGIKLGGVAR